MSDFDWGIPTNKTDADADPIRNNLQRLSVHHIGNVAPTGPQLGYLWLDTSVPTNQKLRQYTQNGVNPAAWVVAFEHMESTPVAPSASQIRTFSAVVDPVTEPYDLTVDLSEKARVVIGMWGYISPTGGIGLFGVEKPSMNGIIAVYPSAAFLPLWTPSNMVDIKASGLNSMWSRKLGLAAPQGQNYVVLDAAYSMGANQAPYYITDGTTSEWLYSIAYGTVPGPDRTKITFATTIQKVGGYNVGDEARRRSDPITKNVDIFNEGDLSNKLFMRLSNLGSIAGQRLTIYGVYETR